MGIKIKFGTCSECKKENVPLKRVRPPECPRCYNYKKALIYKERAKERERNKEGGGVGKTSKTKPKRKRIKQVSDKQKKRLAEYRLVRDKYLENNPICEVHDCNKPTTNLHHKAGRIGDLLSNEEYFMACCETCHPERIHNNPLWSEKHGYIISIR